MATLAAHGDRVSWCGMRARVCNMVGRRAGGGAQIARRGWPRVYTAAKIFHFAVTKMPAKRGCR